MDTALKALAEPRRREILRLVWTGRASGRPDRCPIRRCDPVGRLATPRRPAGGPTGHRAPRRDPSALPGQHAQMDRLRQFLDEYWTGSLQRLQEWPNRPNERKEPLMAELTREVVMDASPATIFPSSPTRPSTSMDGHRGRTRSRVGGAYRVLVQGKHPGVGDFVEVVPDRKVCSPSDGTNPTIRFPLAPPRWRSP